MNMPLRMEIESSGSFCASTSSASLAALRSNRFMISVRNCVPLAPPMKSRLPEVERRASRLLINFSSTSGETGSIRAMRRMTSPRKAGSIVRKISAEFSASRLARTSAQVWLCSPRSICAMAEAGRLCSSSITGEVVACGATRPMTSMALAAPSDFSKTCCAFSTPPRADVTASSVTEENSPSTACCTSAETNSILAISPMICSICR